MKLFEYAVIHRPRRKKSEIDDGQPETANLVVPITPVVAKDVAEVQIIAARKIPENLLGELDRVDVVVRSF